ncbi:DUF6615 family protein [Roseibium sp.]|uniref:DUF6615 family protein n=1 Tax=Roseibium sp. TaxID=1936156 RepID=UPI001B2DA9F8|nr:DUF6615 family protein [Roseibium sp.]MBO6857451.1 hypothetical protein [Roseibium sp.]
MALNVTHMRRFFRQQAGWVWNRQAQAFTHGLSLQEETLTEMLLLQIAKRGAQDGLKVKMFSRAEESINGADWEWFFRTPECGIGFRIQAKRLYRNENAEGRYGGLKKASSQADDLINQSGSNNPIYVFYNHSWTLDSQSRFWGNDYEFRGPSMWGCSVAKASFVRSVGDNKIAKLHSGMLPWHKLFDGPSKCPVAGAFDDMRGEGELTYAERDPDWLGDLNEAGSADRYLAEHNLQGVAHFDFSDFRPPERDPDILYQG